MGAEGHADGTVGKALDVLDIVARQGRPVRFSDLLAQADYPKATLYRLLQTLTNQGMLTLDPDLASPRGQALRVALWLHEQDKALGLLRVG